MAMENLVIETSERANTTQTDSQTMQNVPGSAPDSREITYTWPDTMRRDFGHKIISGTHDAAETNQFCDTELARLLDEYPRDRLGIFRFPDHAEGPVRAEHGKAPSLTGAQILDAVKAGKIWLNLRAVNQVLPRYAELASSLFRQLEAASGAKTLKNDMGVLISSPGIHVHYHLDIPKVCLVQIRGTKMVYFYPVGAPFAEPEQLEQIVLREQDEELNYLNVFESDATVIDFRPGMAVTWPQTAPHRVQNGDNMNVSLSCEYMTTPAIIKANALYANAKLRRMTGYSAAFPKTVGPVTLAKAIGAQLYKKLNPVSPKSPTTITFELLEGGGIKTLTAE